MAIRVPRVAQFLQGEVIQIAYAAFDAQTLGSCVVIEGRRKKLNFVKVNLRVEHSIKNRSSLGARRVAQRLRDQIYSEAAPVEQNLRELLARP